jgi:hypothetical protein
MQTKSKQLTHNREPNKKIYKLYVKCTCGNGLILTNLHAVKCKCGLTFTGGYGMSQPGGQGAKWPTHFKRFIKGRKVQINMDFCFNTSTFSIGRVTRKLLDEIVSLGGEYREYIDLACTDGRTRIGTLTFGFSVYKPRRIEMCGTIYFNGLSGVINNKVLNDRLRGFIKDIRDLKEDIATGVSISKWDAPNAYSEETVVIQTMKKYKY